MRSALYCRISSDDEEQGLGVARQEADCRELASQKGWAVEQVYVDNDMSASRLDGKSKVRPAYEAMIEAIRGGRVGAVVAWELDRLGRDPWELEQFWLECERAGVQVATKADQVDVVTGEGLMVARIKAAVAAEEAKKIRDRTRRKHLELAERGLPKGGGRRGLGYEPDGMTVRENEAQVIRQAAERALRGESLSSIARAAGWQVTTLRKVLLAPRIAGLRAHRGEVVGPAAWPAIIDQETWAQVCKVLNDPKRRGVGGRTRLGSRLLTGMIYCSRCGDKLALATVHGRSGVYYRCRRTQAEGCGGLSIQADPVEELVHRMMIKIAGYMELRHEAPDDGQERETRAALERDRLRLERLEDAYVDGDLDKVSYRRRRRELLERIDVAEAALARQRPEARPWTPSEIEAAWRRPPTDESELAMQRAAVRSVVEKVLVGPVIVPGRHAVDPGRITIVDRWGAEYKGLDFATLEEQLGMT